MTLTDAIRTSLVRSFRFSRRASRAEFWRFFPIGLLLPVLAGSVGFIAGLPVWSILAIAATSALPLFAVGARRLQDTGEAGKHAVAPWACFAASVLLGSWSYKSLSMVSWAFAQPEPPDGPGGFAFAAIYGYGGGFLGLISAILMLVFLFRITPAFAQTLLPSQPGANKYGPNPNEVLS